MKKRTTKKSSKRTPAKRNRTVIKAKKVKVIANSKKRKVANRQDIRVIVREHLRAGRNQKQILSLMKAAGFPPKFVAEAKAIYANEKRAVEALRSGRLKNPGYTVEVIPKTESAFKRSVSALTRGSAIRKVQRTIPKGVPIAAYRYKVEKNPKRRNAVTSERLESIRKEIAKTQAALKEAQQRAQTLRQWGSLGYRVLDARRKVKELSDRLAHLRGQERGTRIGLQKAELRKQKNPRRRNPDLYSDAMKSIKKRSGGSRGNRVYISDVTKDLQKKYSWDQIQRELIEIMRSGEIVLLRLDDPLEITPIREKYSIRSGGQDNHILYYTGKKRQGASGSSGLHIPKSRKREMPAGWSQASEGFQGKAETKKRSKAEEEMIAHLRKAGIKYEPNPKRNPKSDFALAGRITRAIEAIEKKPATIARNAQIKKLQAYLKKVYARAEKALQAEGSAIYAAPRSFASTRKGGGVRKKKNPTLQEMLRGGGIRRVFAESVMDFARASHPDPAMVANLIDLGLKAGMTPPEIKRLLAKKKGTKTAIRLVNARMQQLQRRGDLDSYRAASKNPRRGKKRNPTPAELRKEFAGRYNRDSDLLFPEGTPKGLAKLGKLVLIKCESGPIRPVKGTVWLCSDTKGKLHIGTTKADATSLFSGPKASLGEISRIEYDESKPHLGYINRTIFFHKMGEENGIRPRLVADGRGGLLIKGGDYKIRREGIVN